MLLDEIRDPAQRDHVRERGEWLVKSCTCRTNVDGSRYFMCASNLAGRECSREAQACGGYCRPCFEWTMSQPPPLTFQALMDIDVERCKRWHPGFPNDELWTISDWSNAMAGEAGEACNVVKKIRRHETGQLGVLDPPLEELREKLGYEIADVILYAFLLAARGGVDLELAIRQKFNIVSERQDFPEKLPLPTPPPPRDDRQPTACGPVGGQ